MRKYRLYLEGVSYIDEEGNICNYKIIDYCDSKKAAIVYQKDATITNLSDKILSRAILINNGQSAINVVFDPNELRRKYDEN